MRVYCYSFYYIHITIIDVPVVLKFSQKIDKNIVLQDVVQSLTMQGDVFRHKKEVHVMRPGFQNVMTFISLQKRTDVRIMLFI